MKAILLVVAAAGCTYTPVSTPSDPADPAPDATEPATPDAAVTLPPPCSTPDTTGLVLCLEFDDDVEDGTLVDSSPSRLDAATSGLAPTLRDVPATSPAARIESDAVARIAEAPALDRDAAYTFAAWVRPDRMPAMGEVFGVLDHEHQYAMLIGHPAGAAIENRCVHTGVARYEWTENLTPGRWSFLACTWDGARLCAYRWTSPTDHEHYCHLPTLQPAATGAHGLAIGHLSDGGAAHSRLDGALDSVQIFDRGLTADQLCSLIGRAAGCMP